MDQNAEQSKKIASTSQNVADCVIMHTNADYTPSRAGVTMDRFNLHYLEHMARSRNPELDALMMQALRTSSEIVSADSAQLFLFDGKVLTAVASAGMSHGLQDITFNTGCGIIGQCMDKRSTVVCADLADACPRKYRKSVLDAGVRGVLAVPFELGGEAFGVLALGSKEPRVFTEDEIDAAEVYVQNLALALHHCSFFPELRTDWVRHLRDGRLLVQITCPAQASRDTDRSLSKRVYPPKGISTPTLGRISKFLSNSNAPVSRKDIADRVGLSEVTVGIYLDYLRDTGLVSQETVYGKVGRPKYLYRLR